MGGGRTGGGAGVGERGWGSMLMPVYGEISTLIQSLLPFSPGARRPVERLCLFSPGKLVIGRAVAPSVLGKISIAAHLQMKRVAAGLAIECRHCCCAKSHMHHHGVPSKEKGILGLFQRKMCFIFQTKVSNFGRKLNSIVLAGGCQQISGDLERLSDDYISPDWTQRRTYCIYFF